MSASRPQFSVSPLATGVLRPPTIVSPDLSLQALSTHFCADPTLPGVLVIAETQLLGTASPEDIVRAIAQGENPQTTTVASIMRSPVPTYPTTALTQRDRLLKSFAEQDLSWLTIVDDQGRPVGILTGDRLTDLHPCPVPNPNLETGAQELKFFEEILENAFAGYWDWDLVQDVEYLSPSFKRMFGYADHELPNHPKSWQGLIFPEDLEKVNANLAQHIASCGVIPFCNEVRYRHRDGSTVWVICSGKVIEWDEQGQPQRMIGSNIDFTARKKIEERLKRSEASLQEAQRLAHIGSWEVDLTTGHLYWSPELLRMFGLDPAQAPPSYDEHLALIHPDDRERLKNCVETAIATGNSYVIQYRVQLKNGQIFHHEARGSSQKNASGEIIRFFGTALDITEQVLAEQALRESELRWQFALEGSGDGVWDWNAQTDQVFFSRQWKAMLGYEEDEIGETLSEWENRVHPDDLALVLELIQAHITGQTDIYRSEHRVRCKDGTYKWILDRGQVIQWTADGKPLRIIGTHSDISDRKQAEQELIGAKEAAEAAVNAKSMFLATMSHEIRTPMNGVIGMLNLLLYSDLDAEQQENIHIALSSAESLLVLLNDILDFSKIDAGKLQLEAIEFDLYPFLDNFARSMAFSAQEKGIELLFDLREIRQSTVRGDPGRLRQILLNLVSNALKFTEEGDILIDFRLEPQGDRLRLSGSVRDTGIGIPPEHLEDLFQPFTQLEAGTTRRYGGTGLGLAITHRLCELMGGEIRVTSIPGEGSCFSFSIFCQPSSNQISPIDPSRLRDLEVLLVEEHPRQREILAGQLQRWGATVWAAADAQEAIALWQANPPQSQTPFLFIDHFLQDMEAIALAQQLCQTYPSKNCQLFFLTTSPDSNISLARSLNTSPIRYLMKPILPTQLWEACTQLSKAPSMVRLTSTGSNSGTIPPPTPGRRRLLLVEDNRVNQIVTRGLCQRFGFVVDIAANGLEALRFLREANLAQPYDLILMDCLMPKLNGYHTTQFIRQGKGGDRHRTIPIIALTANAMKGDRDKCLAAGMDDYLSKPLNPQTLQETLNHWLQHRHSFPQSS
ncbi:PAS domain S-box protein [Synechococcus moorigangaii CMS01]|nr:PAS domain S-box protein [Synechococcus moorigangaii CMS01]